MSRPASAVFSSKSSTRTLPSTITSSTSFDMRVVDEVAHRVEVRGEPEPPVVQHLEIGSLPGSMEPISAPHPEGLRTLHGGEAQHLGGLQNGRVAGLDSRGADARARSTSKWSANMLSMPRVTGIPRERYSTIGATWPRTAFMSGQCATAAFDAASTSVSEPPTT